MLSDVPMVRAGDVLVVAFEEHQTEAATRQFVDMVNGWLPGVRVAVMEGVSGLVVFRPEVPDGPTVDG